MEKINDRIIHTGEGDYAMHIEQRGIIIYKDRRYEVIGGISFEKEIGFGGVAEGGVNYYTRKDEPSKAVSLLEVARPKIQVGDRIVARCIEKDGWMIGNNGIVLLPGKIIK